MKRRAATILGLIILMMNLCHAQAVQSSTTAGDIYAVIEHIGKMMQGGDFDTAKQYVSPEAIVVSGKTTARLQDVLKGKDRGAVLHEDPSRQMVEITARSNKNEDAIYVVLKTVSTHKEDPRFHSLVLYKEPETGWRVFLWHVGME